MTSNSPSITHLHEIPSEGKNPFPSTVLVLKSEIEVSSNSIIDAHSSCCRVFSVFKELK